MMTEEQRYLFDLCGFLHLKNVLTPEELDAASEAARRYIDSAPEDLPPHSRGGQRAAGARNARIARNGALHPQKGNRHSTTGVPQPVIRGYEMINPHAFRRRSICDLQ